jgi:FAD/FMN-containing dehydrogenase
MKARFLKKIWFSVGLLIFLLLILITHPAFHVVRAIWNDRDEITAPPAGAANDASRLNESRVTEVWKIPADSQAAEAQLAGLLQRARTNHLKVSIAGARHSMGGHTIYPDGVVIDMLPFNRMELDESNNVLHVQAGARWGEVIRYLNQSGRSVEVMQSNDDFSIGGSISVNCHGWQFNRPPIASTVESFRLMLTDGKIVKCSRTENHELFSLVLGGYGLFGIILDVDLRVVPNEKYKIERIVVPTADYVSVLAKKTASASDVAMIYGRLNMTAENFLQEGIINVFHRLPATGPVVTSLNEPGKSELKRALFRGSVGDEYGKELRWDAEKWLDPFFSGNQADRNAILYVPAGWYLDHTQKSTDILMECFVPPAQFEPFLQELRKIIPGNRVDLLNLTVRHLNRDDDTFLRYADKDMIALVLFFSQTRDARGEENMKTAAREIIAAALRHDGRYYLPYRLHATPEQFAQGYPQAKSFFELKRKYDPDELFQNEFYLKYGK